MFNNLERADIDKIIDIELSKLFGRVDQLGYQLDLSDEAKDFIAEKGFDKEFGARPLKRSIQKYVEDALAEEIINSKLQEGDTINLTINEDKTGLAVNIKKKKLPKTPKE